MRLNSLSMHFSEYAMRVMDLVVLVTEAVGSWLPISHLHLTIIQDHMRLNLEENHRILLVAYVKTSPIKIRPQPEATGLV
jgi:hypothetical protein